MAKKQRFRDTKKNKTTKGIEKRVKPTIPYANNRQRAKAFLTDIFMLFMPIMYAVIYLVMEGREGASEQKLLAWVYVMIPYLLLLTFFMWKDEGRTPGARSQGLTVIDFYTLDKPSLFSIVFRNLMLPFSLFIPIFWFVPLFRKDKRTIHDLLSATCLIVDPNPPKNLEVKTKSTK